MMHRLVSIINARLAGQEEKIRAKLAGTKLENTDEAVNVN